MNLQETKGDCKVRAFFFIASSLVFANAAYGNRILDPKYNDSSRCAVPSMSFHVCAEEQQSVLDLGWVTPEELTTLRERNLLPIFTREGRLIGVCPCSAQK